MKKLQALAAQLNAEIRAACTSNEELLATLVVDAKGVASELTQFLGKVKGTIHG